jgi:uncharacterized membrane protein YhaH (DUF805 family)
MTFGESIKTCFKQYATFSGRASRSELWWFLLFTLLVSAGAGIIAEAIGALVYLALLLPNLAVQVRRLHDVDKSGWWLLIMFIPLIGLILLYWFVLPSTEGANEYGEGPALADAS